MVRSVKGSVGLLGEGGSHLFTLSCWLGQGLEEISVTGGLSDYQVKAVASNILKSWWPDQVNCGAVESRD